MNHKKNNTWERLRFVIEQTGHNVNSFAQAVGLPRSENLYQIKKGNNGISLKLATLIHERFPAYSLAWLMCGDNPEGGAARIPVYKDPYHPLFEGEPGEYLGLTASAANGAAFAVSFPVDLPNLCLMNALVLFRKSCEQILYGNFYLIVTPDVRLLGTMRYEPDPAKLRLITLWPKVLGEVVIERKDVVSFWQVCGAVCRMY